MPSPRLFPTPAPLPAGFGGVLAALLVTAALTLAPAATPGTFPGNPALPYGPVTLNLHDQVHGRGVYGYLADDLHNLPYRIDRTVTDGFPLDALASAPFTALLGFELGMWAYALALVWAVGATGAWLGARWWGSARAALVTGVAWQTTEVVLRELGDGRSTQVFAAALLPLCLGLGVLAATPATATPATTPRAWPRPLVAVAAGVCAALTMLTSWDFAALALPLVLGPALLLRNWPAAATILAAAGALTLPAAGWVWSGISELPSASSSPWKAAPIGGALLRPADLAAERIYGLDGVAIRTLARPALLALALGATGLAWRARADLLRPRWWPAVVLGLGAVLGLGFWLPGPVVAPWGLAAMVKPLLRLWWPDRAWLLPGLALALLAGGAVARATVATHIHSARLRDTALALAAAAALLVEAHLLSPALPLAAIPLAPSDTARALAESYTPVLVLPPGGSPLRADRLDLVDQVLHQRATAAGTRPATDLTASRSLNRIWLENPSLRAIATCERHADATRGASTESGEALVHIGIREVWLDQRYLQGEGGPAYAACVARGLAGWSVVTEAGFTRYRAPASLGQPDIARRSLPGRERQLQRDGR